MALRAESIVALLGAALFLCPGVRSQTCSDPRAQATVFLVNGIDTPTEEDADWNKRELEGHWLAHVRDNGMPIEAGCVTFNYAYNTSLGIPLDLFEAARQLGIHPTAFWRIWAGLTPTPQWFEDLTQGHIISSLVAYVNQRDLQAQVAKYREAISRGNRVVAVGHSHGNLFANDAYRELYGDPNPVDTRSFNVVAVATPASFVAGQGPYTTVEGDIIAGMLMRLLFGTLAPNTLVGDCGGPFDCHRFVETYLGRDASRGRILEHILAAILGQTTTLPWSAFQHDAQHTGRTISTGPNWNSDADVRIKWAVLVPNSSLQSPLVASNGTVLVGGSDNTTGRGVLAALNPQDGTEVWRTIDFAAAPTSAAIGPDGTIYVCAGAPVGQFGALYALASTGTLKWRFNLPQGPHISCNAPIISRSGVIYITTPPPLNQQVAALYAVNPDGTEKWRYEETNNGTTMAALSLNESQVYAAFHSRLVAFDAETGQKLWEQVPPNSFANLILGGFGPTVDGADRIVLVTFEPNRDCGLHGNSLVAYDKDGNFLWHRPNISCANGLRSVGVNQGELMVDGFTVLLRIDAQKGNQVGSFIVLPGVASGGAAIDGLSRAYITTSAWFNVPGSQNGLAAVDATRVVWFLPTNNLTPQSPPAIGPNGTIYFVAGNTVFAIGQ